MRGSSIRNSFDIFQHYGSNVRHGKRPLEKQKKGRCHARPVGATRLGRTKASETRLQGGGPISGLFAFLGTSSD